MSGDSRHIPVMAREIVDLLRPRPGMRVLDATVGLGGHSLALLERLEGEVEILGLDRDASAIERARENLAGYAGRVTLRRSRFSGFRRALDELGWDGVDAALADLGVSSPQLDEPERGFSFLHDGPLDMRMSPADGLEPAENLVNRLSFERLRDIIRDMGEEPQAGRIARAIEAARAEEAHRVHPGAGGHRGAGLSAQVAGHGPQPSGHPDLPGPAHGREPRA